MVSARQVSTFLSVAVLSTLFFFPHTTFACEAGTDIGGNQCRVFFGTTAFNIQSWMIPGDWTDTNTVECFGLGGDGDYGTDGVESGGGGGGGAYAKSVNLTGLVPGTRIVFRNGFSGTWFNASSTFPTSGQVCGAQYGHDAVGSTAGAGGSAASSYAVGPGNVTYSGGDGANGLLGAITLAGGGGGGAAGPNGDGADASGSTGGSADAGFGGTGGTAGNDGGDGTEIDSNHGSGGGGGGGADSDDFAGYGGSSGGGAGGGGMTPGEFEGEPGSSGLGFIMVTYTSAGTTTKHQVIQTFTSSGTFTVPSGVTGITLEGWGGGGGAQTNVGSGGGGAYTLLGNLPVTAGQLFTITVGAAGAAGGSNGGTTTIVRSGTTYLQAQGGRGGSVANGSAGGSINFLIGDTGNTGGAGRQTTGDWSGGGGAGSEFDSFASPGQSGSCFYAFGGDYFGGSSCDTVRESLYGAGGATRTASSDAGTIGLARILYYLDTPGGFPLIKTRFWDRDGFGGGASQSVNLPPELQAGDLLLLLVTGAASSSIAQMTVSTPTGWTLLANQTSTSVLRLIAFYKIANGTEGTTVSIDSSSSQFRPTSIVYRITNYTGTPIATGGTSVTPPQLSAAAYSKNLWITAVARKMDNVSGVRSVTAPPNAYGNFIYNPPLLTSGSSSGQFAADLSVADRQLLALLETPGSFTSTGSVSATASLTIEIPGAGASTTPRLVRLKGGTRFISGIRLR